MAPSESGSSPRASGASGSAPRRTALAAALAAALACGPAHALFNDRLELWAAQNVTYDNNVFRISDALEPSTIGASKRGDTIFTTHLGVNLNIPVSLQRFDASFDWFRSTYDTFKDLDYDGHRARAAWNFNYANRVTGVASINESRGLSSFANIQARQKDLVRARQADVSAAWMATPRWRLDGRVVAAETEHSSPVRQLDEIETRGVEAGLSYLTPSDNFFGASARLERGESPHGSTAALPSVGGALIDNEYRQWAAGATATWNVTAASRLDGRLEWLERRYDRFTDRNYDGPAFRAVYTWAPTVKTTIAFGALRDMGPPEDVQATRVLVTGAYVRPRWIATEKITLTGNIEYNVYEYKGGVALLPTGARITPAGGFEHRQRLIGASLMWKPFQRVWVNAGYVHEKRTSTVQFADYDVDVIFVEGRVGF
jgi:exopolysaccharide biosynthesis operon protein EpsL